MRHAGCPERRDGEQHRGQDADRRHPQRVAADPRELAQVHLHPDLEQQEDRADLSERREEVVPADQPEQRGPDGDPQHDLEQHGCLAAPLGDLGGHPRRDEDDQQVHEDGLCAHDTPLAGCTAAVRPPSANSRRQPLRIGIWNVSNA